jgi:hypothetical protein
MRTATVVLLAISAPAAWSQQVISARAGTVHYVEGRVLVNEKAVEPKQGEFPTIPEGGVLKSEEGRVEVLLAPGIFLRMAENSSLKMTSTRLEDTQIEVLSGSVLIEAAEMFKENRLAVTMKDQTVELRKKGLYRFDAEFARVRVYDGQALVAGLNVKQEREFVLGSEAPVKFDTEIGDAFLRWSRRRAENISIANISAARYLSKSSSFQRGGWIFNDYFGMLTYVPLNGIILSPFGFRYYSPSQVYALYYPPARPAFRGWEGGGPAAGWGGYNTGPRTASVSMGGGAPAPVSSSTGASTARTSESSSPRGGEGGGRGR